MIGWKERVIDDLFLPSGTVSRQLRLPALFTRKKRNYTAR